jgi:hypothetical protein
MAIPADWSGPPARRRVLLVVTGPVRSSQLKAILAGDPPCSAAVLVVAPALQRSWLRYWVSDTDEGREHEGVPSEGHVGSADPLTAIEDALRLFQADEVVIAMYAGGRRRYRERDLRGDVERRFGIPATAIDLPAAS